MDRFGIGAMSGILLLATVSCTRDSDAVLAEQKKTNEHLKTIGEKLDALARIRPQGGGDVRPKPPPRPKPGVLYSVPVNDNDAFRGGKHAKVTIVDAFEYA